MHLTRLFRFCPLLLQCLMLACLSTGVRADEACSAWAAAATDATQAKYPVQLRVCDMTYGLSTALQIQNESDLRLHLYYRVTSGDDKSKDTDSILEPHSINRAGSCQACAKRHAGFKQWDILDAKVMEITADQAAAATKSPETPKVETPAKPQTTNAYPEKIDPVASKPPIEKIDIAPPKVEASKPAVNQPQPAVPATANPSQENKPATKSEADGFKTEDGRVIPWDQMPPEFRPHAK